VVLAVAATSNSGFAFGGQWLTAALAVTGGRGEGAIFVRRASDPVTFGAGAYSAPGTTTACVAPPTGESSPQPANNAMANTQAR